MPNVRKVMARLNPRSLPLVVSGGRGTNGGQSAIDIAGMLAVTKGNPHRRLAVHALCLRWWPEVMYGPDVVVGHRLVPSERGDIKIPITAPSERPALAAIKGVLARQLGSYIEKNLDDSALRVRALTPEFLELWSKAVVDEFRFPNVCRDCSETARPGLVWVRVEVEGKPPAMSWATCAACHGSGTVAWGKARRAKQLRMRYETFAAHLDKPHSAAVALLSELEQRGAQLVAANMAD